MTRREATVERATRETQIQLTLSLDGGSPRDETTAGDRRSIDVPDGFFAHMLDALSTHGGLGIMLQVVGDVEVDLHHTVEDTGIVLGTALADALGDRRGITRFATAYAPLDEALARAVIDFSGRGFLVHSLPTHLEQAWIKPTFPLDLIVDFFQAFADHGRFTLHLDVLRARNAHHAAEAAFKAVALAIRQAVTVRGVAIPSTKGSLDG